MTGETRVAESLTETDTCAAPPAGLPRSRAEACELVSGAVSLYQAARSALLTLLASDQPDLANLCDLNEKVRTANVAAVQALDAFLHHADGLTDIRRAHEAFTITAAVVLNTHYTLRYEAEQMGTPAMEVEGEEAAGVFALENALLYLLRQM